MMSSASYCFGMTVYMFVFVYRVHMYIEARGCSVTQLQIYLAWLTSKPQDDSSPHPSVDITGMCLHALLFYMGVGNPTTLLMFGPQAFY